MEYYFCNIIFFLGMLMAYYMLKIFRLQTAGTRIILIPWMLYSLVQIIFPVFYSREIKIEVIFLFAIFILISLLGYYAVLLFSPGFWNNYVKSEVAANRKNVNAILYVQMLGAVGGALFLVDTLRDVLSLWITSSADLMAIRSGIGTLQETRIFSEHDTLAILARIFLPFTYISVCTFMTSVSRRVLILQLISPIAIIVSTILMAGRNPIVHMLLLIFLAFIIRKKKLPRGMNFATVILAIIMGIMFIMRIPDQHATSEYDVIDKYTEFFSVIQMPWIIEVLRDIDIPIVTGVASILYASVLYISHSASQLSLFLDYYGQMEPTWGYYQLTYVFRLFHYLAGSEGPSIQILISDDPTLGFYATSLRANLIDWGYLGGLFVSLIFGCLFGISYIKMGNNFVYHGLFMFLAGHFIYAPIYAISATPIFFPVVLYMAVIGGVFHILKLQTSS